MERRSAAASHVPSARVASVLRSLWTFLGDPNGKTQHTAAFVWVALLRVWPSVGASVVAHELRSAPTDELLTAHLARFSPFMARVPYCAHRAALLRTIIITASTIIAASTTAGDATLRLHALHTYRLLGLCARPTRCRDDARLRRLTTSVRSRTHRLAEVVSGRIRRASRLTPAFISPTPLARLPSAAAALCLSQAARGSRVDARRHPTPARTDASAEAINRGMRRRARLLRAPRSNSLAKERLILSIVSRRDASRERNARREIVVRHQPRGKSPPLSLRTLRISRPIRTARASDPASTAWRMRGW